MKRCELCCSPARMYCESDEASLCWDCDEKVHSANFLVAKHSRSLLCHVCQSPTPWQAAGPKLSLNVSVCLSCVASAEKSETGEDREEDSQGADEFEDDDSDDDGESSESDDEEEDGENQVVPLSSSPSSLPVAYFSGREDVSSSRFSDGDAGYVSSFKRTREDSDLNSQDEIGGSFSRFHRTTASAAIMSYPSSEDDEANSVAQSMMVQRRSKSLGIQDRDEAESSRTVPMVNSLKRFRQTLFVGGDNQYATILEICKFTRDASVVCINSSNYQ